MLSQEKIDEIREVLEGLSPEEQQKKFKEILAALSSEEKEQLLGKQQCPFCLMAQEKIPHVTIYEDQDILGILDIHPANKGHVLLFPKEHHHVLNTVPNPIVKELFSIANKLATAIFDSVEAQGTNILVANGPAAGQTAPHLLINIIPRFTKDKVRIEWEAQTFAEKDLETLAKKIQEKIPKKETVSMEKKELFSIRDTFERIP